MDIEYPCWARKTLFLWTTSAP